MYETVGGGVCTVGENRGEQNLRSEWVVERRGGARMESKLFENGWACARILGKIKGAGEYAIGGVAWKDT